MALIWVFFLLSNKSGWWTWWVPVRVRRWPQHGTRRLKAFFLCHNECNHDFHHHQQYLNRHHHHHQQYLDHHHHHHQPTKHHLILDNIMTTWNNMAPLSFFSMSARAELSPAGRSYNIKTEKDFPEWSLWLIPYRAILRTASTFQFAKSNLSDKVSSSDITLPSPCR